MIMMMKVNLPAGELHAVEFSSTKFAGVEVFSRKVGHKLSRTASGRPFI
jgi:hypothetical protein